MKHHRAFLAQRRGPSAFTLIELLIVVTVIAILAAMILEVMNMVRFKSRVVVTNQRMEAILEALTQYGRAQGSGCYMIQSGANLGGTLLYQAAVRATATSHITGGVVTSVSITNPGVGYATAPTVTFSGGTFGANATGTANINASGTVTGITLLSGGNSYSTAPNILIGLPTSLGGSVIGVGTNLDVTKPYNFGFPWNHENLIGSLDTKVQTITDPVNGRTHLVSTVKIGDLNPMASESLLALVGILPPDDPATANNETQDAYRTDRTTKQPWNDAWGNPLVVAYGLFQPEDAKLIASAMTAYQYSRSVYIAVAAAGQSLQTPLSTDWTTVASNQQLIWNQATAICSPPGTPMSWTYAAFDRPPWQGSIQTNATIAGKNLGSCLTAPIEIK